LIQAYLKDKFPDAKNILLLSEDHLKNIYYWENVITLSDLLRDSGYTVVVGMLSPDLQEATELQSFSGKTIRVEKVFSDSGQLITAQGPPDLVISNNDFSNPYSDVGFQSNQDDAPEGAGLVSPQEAHLF
jgi:glutamate--cysteine ligase